MAIIMYDNSKVLNNSLGVSLFAKEVAFPDYTEAASKIFEISWAKYLRPDTVKPFLLWKLALTMSNYVIEHKLLSYKAIAAIPESKIDPRVLEVACLLNIIFAELFNVPVWEVTVTINALVPSKHRLTKKAIDNLENYHNLTDSSGQIVRVDKLLSLLRSRLILNHPTIAAEKATAKSKIAKGIATKSSVPMDDLKDAIWGLTHAVCTLLPTQKNMFSYLDKFPSYYRALVMRGQRKRIVNFELDKDLKPTPAEEIKNLGVFEHEDFKFILSVFDAMLADYKVLNGFDSVSVFSTRFSTIVLRNKIHSNNLFFNSTLFKGSNLYSYDTVTNSVTDVLATIIGDVSQLLGPGYIGDLLEAHETNVNTRQMVPSLITDLDEKMLEAMCLDVAIVKYDIVSSKVKIKYSWMVQKNPFDSMTQRGMTEDFKVYAKYLPTSTAYTSWFIGSPKLNGFVFGLDYPDIMAVKETLQIEVKIMEKDGNFKEDPVTKTWSSDQTMTVKEWKATCSLTELITAHVEKYLPNVDDDSQLLKFYKSKTFDVNSIHKRRIATKLINILNQAMNVLKVNLILPKRRNASIKWSDKTYEGIIYYYISLLNNFAPFQDYCLAFLTSEDLSSLNELHLVDIDSDLVLELMESAANAVNIIYED